MTTTILNDRVTLTVTEVAGATGLSEVMLRKHIADGGIPSIKVGRRRLIPATWLTTLTAKDNDDAR